MNVYGVFPQYIIKNLPETGSTNLYMEELLRNDSPPEGSVVYTEVQTAGIGHAENKWESEAHKNLTATVLLNPVFLKAANQFYLTVITSLSVAATVEFFVPGAQSMIKWPNDIFVNHRKIAGILIKNHIMGADISASIIGVGLNINQTDFLTAPNATSLNKNSGKEFSIIEVMTKWHELLAEYYYALQNGKQQLMDLYLSKMYLRDVPADYRINDCMVRATIKGVDQHGLLVLCDEHNKKYICGLKEIVFPVLG